MLNLKRGPQYTSLSIRDLLDAREAYHVHLANLDNVVGTAIGRYLLRDLDAGEDPSALDIKPEQKPPRTLFNSSIQRWSWPCVLVFVDRWIPLDDFRNDPSQYIPDRLYLPDGRVVPTCVVLAPRYLKAHSPLRHLRFPSGMLGGGYPVLTDFQQQERIGSIGCLLTDGTYTYAVTSRHVVGEHCEEGYTIDRGGRRLIATSYGRGADKVLFADAYPGWAGGRTYVNLDVGLFKIKDMNEWTSQVYGIGKIGELIDLNVDTLSLDLISIPVRATGGASGLLQGQISALFYRYRAVGGFDYIAEFIIGPRKGQQSVLTQPGDSGTIWFWDSPLHEKVDSGEPENELDTNHRTPEYRPLAIQWGGHSFLEPGGQEVMQFALASSLATVCRRLDLEIVRDWSIGQSQFWGKVGHYKIGTSACFMISEKNLYKLVQANAENISVSDTDIEAGRMPDPHQGQTFVALADVPDLVWRDTRKMDEANHFADMDEPGSHGSTLLQMWSSDPSSRTPAAWTKFYDGFTTPRPDNHRGALPFRIRQVYKEMVKFVLEGDVASYICAAGILAHYVGDACQPLHVSFLHHGDPKNPDESPVHSVYETKMLDHFRAELINGINQQTAGSKVKKVFKGEDAAADAVVELMAGTIQRLAPSEVVQAYRDSKGREQLQAMWNRLGERTVNCMADGALCLATIWESAWQEGGGPSNVRDEQLVAIDRNTLVALYSTSSFLQSRWLRDM